MVTQLQQLRVSDENTRSAMKRHISSFEKTRKDDQRSFMLVDGRLKSVEEMLLECTGKVQKHSKNMKILTADMKHITGELGGVMGMQQEKEQKDESNPEEARRNSVVSHAEALTSRFGRLEEAVNQLTKSQSFEKEAIAKRHKEVADLSVKTAAEMKDATLALDGFQKNQRLLEDRVMRSETRIAQEETNMEKCQKQAEKFENDLRGVSVSLKENSTEMEFQKHELTKTNGILSGTRQDLETTNGNVEELSTVFGELQGAMIKIGTRLELAHEYFNGMSKGFQDTHKRVSSGLDGMIAPKVMSARKVLPEIPGSRPASEQSRSSPSPPLPR